MSDEYKTPDEVPNKVICDRLDVLVNVLIDVATNGRDAINKEFCTPTTMQSDHNIDSVLLIMPEKTPTPQSKPENNDINNARLIAELQGKCEDYEGALALLWGILDDIDTSSDRIKGNDSAYRSRVERLQGNRWKSGITTDGYSLDFSGINEVLTKHKNKP